MPDSVLEPTIPGLYVLPDFVSEAEEAALLSSIDAHPWHKLLRRKVQHYGYEFVYGANNIDPHKKIGEMPEFVTQDMRDRIEALLRGFAFDKDGYAVQKERALQEEIKVDGDYFEQHGFFDQLTINNYETGQGIPPHVDTHSPFEEVINNIYDSLDFCGA